MTARSALAMALLLSAGGPGASSSEPLLARGTQDLSLELSPDFEGVTGDTLTLEVGYGRFVKDRFELRARAVYETIEDVAPGEKDYRAREVALGCEYNFALGNRFVPYAGVDLGYRRLSYLDIENSGAVYGPRAGLKLFLAENVALDLSLAYKLASADLYVNDFQLEDRDLSYGLGFRVMF